MSEAHSVLLLESEILVRQPLAEYLRDCGFRVIEAATVAEAKTLLETEELQVDVVLADAGAEAEAVFTLSQWIRHTYPTVVVMLSGNAIKVAQEAGELCNEGRALVKPYDHQRVLEHIKRRLAGRKL
jgi:DNA-binding response OmpR family regulator